MLAIVAHGLATARTGSNRSKRPSDGRERAVTVVAMSTPQASQAEPTTGSLPSPELLQAIEAVREQLPTATDFDELFALFDDRVVRSPGLWSSSRRVGHDLLYGIIMSIAPRLRPGFHPVRSSFLEVRGTGFWHGAVYGSNAMACVFYCERSRMGLMALCNPFDSTGMTHYVRITRVVHPNPDGSERLPN